MAASTWDDSHRTEVETIDAQHREMIALLGGVREAAAAGRGARQVAGLFSRLAGTIASHFRDEELLMRARQWPSSEAHLREHGAMLDLVRRIELDLQMGRIQPATALMQALAEHLAGHTAREAAEYRRESAPPVEADSAG